MTKRAASEKKAGPLGPRRLGAHRRARSLILLPSRLERVDHVGAQRVLTMPQMLHAGDRVHEVVVREYVLARIVMTIFEPSQQSGDLRDLIAERLRDFPQR